MSQRSNRKQKFLSELKRKGYNPPGTNLAKSIPVGYDGIFFKKEKKVRAHGNPESNTL